VIITCEKCETRFKLDDARISPDGVKVRCSRCKHAFRVAPPAPPGASDADLADALAREAVAPAASDQTQTLGPADEHEDQTQVLDHDAMDLVGSSRAGDEPEEESDWEFNEDPADAAAEPPPPPDSGLEAPIQAAAPPPPLESFNAAPEADPMSEFLASEPGAAEDSADDSLADLGSPEEWDLLGPDDGSDPTSGAAPALDAAHDPSVAKADDAAVGESLVEEEAEADAEAAPSTLPDSLHEPAVGELRLDVGRGSLASRTTRSVAWAAVAGLLMLAAWASLRPPSPLPLTLTVTDLGVLQATDVRAGVVENAVAGPLLVVSGLVRNPQAGPRLPQGALRVRLVDGGGSALADAEAWLAPAPEAADLRELAPRDLLGAQALGAEALARTPLAPGESMPVAAVFAAIPAEARGFRLEVVERLSSEASRPSPLPASE
jgi:predicted Zn finger-like uncharacterized protein